MARDLFEPAIITPLDRNRYAGLPKREQRRLLKKKLRTLEAGGVRPEFKHAPGSPQGMPYWQALAFLDELLECPLCAKALRDGRLPDPEAG